MQSLSYRKSYLPAVAEVDRAQRWRELARCSARAARRKVSYELAVKYQILPMTVIESGAGRTMLTALSGSELSVEDERSLRFACGCELIRECSHASSIERAIHAAYIGDELHPDLNALSGEADRLVDELLKRAVVLGASDLHIEPTEQGCALRYRVDGALRGSIMLNADPGVPLRIARRIRVLANLAQDRGGEPREGSFSAYVGRKLTHFRLSMVGCVRGEKIALRVLGNDAYALDDCRSWSAAQRLLIQFGMTVRQIQLLRAALARRSGAVIVGGPTGSGKSTLLHLLISVLAGQGQHIVTIEDPVERQLRGVSQIPVNRDAGQTFADVLPLVLRQDPDIIMVGEIRDLATAETALSAGLTGHLVLSTVHAATSIEVVERLRQLKVGEELIGSSVQLIAAQRLLPKNCTSCAIPLSADPYISRALRIPPELKLRVGSGCEVCEGAGLLGRVGAYELIPLHGEFRDLAFSRQSPKHKQSQLELLLAKVQLQSLPQRIRMHVLEGTVSPANALFALGLASTADKAA